MSEVASELVAKPIGSLLSRVARSTKNWVVGKLPAQSVLKETQRRCAALGVALEEAVQNAEVTQSALHERESRCSALDLSLRHAIRNLQTLCDQLLHLDPSNGRFDAHKVLVEAHTKQLFNGATPTILRCIRETSMVQVSHGSDHGVIAGVTIHITWPRGGYSERYVLAATDVHDDHVCFRPSNPNVAAANPADLIVSFVSSQDLNEFENAVASALDVAWSAIEKYRAVLGPEPIEQ